MTITLDRDEAIEILEEIARNANNAAARIAALRGPLRGRRPAVRGNAASPGGARPGLGEFDEAAAAASEATEKESTNWRTWLILSRIEAERGRAKASLDAYRSAQQLNPRSFVFAP
jgi:tetratricopeptide (TPR) repeat protein